MRRFIYVSTILILAINGIVCACPSEMSIEDHSSHQMLAEPSSDNRSDCCENCDEMSAVRMHGELVFVAYEKFDDRFFETPTKFGFEIHWDKDPSAQRSFANRHNPVLPPTPVIFFDRMLD